MTQKNVLIVEDLLEEFTRYKGYLEAHEHLVHGAGSLDRAREILIEAPIDIVLTDMHLTKSNKAEGLEVLAIINDNYPHIISIAMSSDPQIQLAKKAKDLGALTFIRKPIMSDDEIIITINNAIANKTVLNNAKRLSKTPPIINEAQANIINGTVISEEEKKLVLAAAKHPEIAVILLGETGTGKEKIAELIYHYRTKLEGDIPLVTLNCANIKGDLAASQLFGHKKGAFTGAANSTVGAVASANGGILFLDEIHPLPMETQRQLLRVLNDGKYSRVGENTEHRSKFQVIVATTEDLDGAVDAGNFLIDLRMRLTGIDFKLKPLRERPKDIPTLLQLFLAEQNAEIEPTEFTKLIERCKQYYWRGNIRQLNKVIQALVVYSTLNDTEIKAQNLPEYKTMFAANNQEEGTLDIPYSVEEAVKKIIQSVTQDVRLEEVIREVEKTVISNSLERNSKIADCYKGLGISRTNLDIKRKKYGL